MASISGVYEEILVAATDGTLAADVRPGCPVGDRHCREGDRRERGSAGGGGRFGYDYFELDGLGEPGVWLYARRCARPR